MCYEWSGTASCCSFALPLPGSFALEYRLCFVCGILFDFWKDCVRAWTGGKILQKTLVHIASADSFYRIIFDEWKCKYVCSRIWTFYDFISGSWMSGNLALSGDGTFPGKAYQASRKRRSLAWSAYDAGVMFALVCIFSAGKASGNVLKSHQPRLLMHGLLQRIASSRRKPCIRTCIFLHQRFRFAA